jgi:hypothetical protein
MIIRAASILVVVLGLSPGAMAGSHTGVLLHDGPVLCRALFSDRSRTICTGQGSYQRRH